ncbi:MAG: NUDIX hydrolase [Tissierellia bacterium]|nr:NUDIX hydrolase [Tissierellia bacterium]
MIFEENTIKSEKIYEGKVVGLRVDTVELPDQKYSKREIVEHVGGVGILAINSEGKIILVKQYRKAVDRVLLEIPAGKLELNEEPRETAGRELEEETGYIAKDIKYLSEIYPTPGYCSEKIHLFQSTDLEVGKQDLDDNEYLDVHEYTIDEVVKMIERGDIIDAKTIVAVLLYTNSLKDR